MKEMALALHAYIVGDSRDASKTVKVLVYQSLYKQAEISLNTLPRQIQLYLICWYKTFWLQMTNGCNLCQKKAKIFDRIMPTNRMWLSLKTEINQARMTWKIISLSIVCIWLRRLDSIFIKRYHLLYVRTSMTLMKRLLVR